uniref:Acetyl-coenzyme A carboxylase carboxyl transferase subunit beta n=1 Tax=Cuscuta nitida TaxID=192831 RepID=A0A7H0DGF9_9ASTE|nr:acetyl-CoA carboxylase beta subunit [Cuscuta nitida]QNP08419.1 acetyl-CoA carboxylase beta subunit [Cuscuta nitida]
MERWGGFSFQNEFERRWDRKKSLDSFGIEEKTSDREYANRKDLVQNIESWENRYNSSCSKGSPFVGVNDRESFIYDDTFIVRDRNGDSYSMYFEIHKDHSFFSEPFYPDWDSRSQIQIEIAGSIDSYIQSEIGRTITTESGSAIDSDMNGLVFCGESCNRKESERSRRRIRTKVLELILKEKPTNLKKYRHLWLQCENCYEFNYKKLLKSKRNICDQCGYYLEMSSSERIELLIDQGTWNPMDDDMISQDPIQFFHLKRGEAYHDRLHLYQRTTGLTEAVQTGIGQLNGIPIAIGVMDFKFMGGSMGSVVGEKITRLIEHATNKFLPLIIVCASGGARMQEGSFSLMQMAKIAAALYDYQSTKRLFFLSILTSPTAGGVTASFGMLGDILITEPHAYVAFAGKRVIQETLNQSIPDEAQQAEFLFDKGLLDLIVPRHLLKSVIGELFRLHALFPFNPKKHCLFISKSNKKIEFLAEYKI